jgi:hypothetical protein
VILNSGGFGFEFLRRVDAKRESNSGSFGFEFLRRVMGDEGVDGGLDLALHHHGELMVG